MIRSTRLSFRALLALAAVSLSAEPLAAQGAQKQTAGIEFDMKTTMTAAGGMSGMLSGMTPGYTGHGVQTGNRVRIDITDGALPPLAEKGDYIVFDTSGMTVVHPAKKEFVPIPKDFASKMFEQMQSMGMSITVGASSISLDSLPGTDTIAGYPTRHYRSTLTYSMTLEGMGMSQQLKSTTTGEYWTAQIPGLSTSPLQRTNQLTGGQGMSSISAVGPLKDLASKSDSVMRRMSGIALRTRMNSTSDTGAGDMSLDMNAELSNLKRAPIDDTLFVIPADYTKGASPFPSHHH